MSIITDKKALRAAQAERKIGHMHTVHPVEECGVAVVIRPVYLGTDPEALSGWGVATFFQDTGEMWGSQDIIFDPDERSEAEEYAAWLWQYRTRTLHRVLNRGKASE